MPFTGELSKSITMSAKGAYERRLQRKVEKREGKMLENVESGQKGRRSKSCEPLSDRRI